MYCSVASVGAFADTEVVVEVDRSASTGRLEPEAAVVFGAGADKQAVAGKSVGVGAAAGLDKQAAVVPAGVWV